MRKPRSRNDRKTSELSGEPEDSPRGATKDSPLSLNRLREAFAAMLGDSGQSRDANQNEIEAGAADQNSVACEINPRSVVEAILFVGNPENRPFSPRELAAAMRGVSPSEVDSAAARLNERYDADSTPYYIEQSNAGYRLVLRPEFERIRDKFYGRVKEARLSPAALEVLSVLAYRQPATCADLDAARGAASGAALATLVRRRLVKLDRPADSKVAALYSTTERFLKLFGLENLDALPRSEELEPT